MFRRSLMKFEEFSEDSRISSWEGPPWNSSRLIASVIQASHLNDDTLERALDTLYDYGATELYPLIAATAAARLGFMPRFAHFASTSSMSMVATTATSAPMHML